MKRFIIAVLIIATILSVCIVPMASATTSDTTNTVTFKGDSITSDRIETDEEWASAFKVFSQLRDIYYGIGNANPNVRVTFNVGGNISEGSYDRGIFHDLWPDSALTGNYVYNNIYYADRKGYQYKNGDVIEFGFESTTLSRPIVIDIIDFLGLDDVEETWRRADYGEYDASQRGYTKSNAPTIRFKNGKVVNVAFTMGSGTGKTRCEVNFEYGTAIVPLPPELMHLRTGNNVANSIDNAFSGIDYGVASFMNKIARSFLGNIATHLANAVSLVTEKGLVFFLVAIILMCFAKTRKAGVLMFGAVAIGAIFTNFILKDLIMRTRPYETNTLYYGFWKAVGSPIESGYSFPSGHTTAVMAAATAFFISFNKKYSWVGFIVVLAVGVSRIYLMAHYTSDVIFAIIVGGVAGVASMYIAKLLYYIVGRFPNNELCKAILTKDVIQIFIQKKGEEEKSDTATNALDEEKTEQIDEKPTESREDTLVALMTEVRDLLKTNNADQTQPSDIETQKEAQMTEKKSE